MRRLMLVFLCSLFMLFAASRMRADALDPQVIISEPLCGEGDRPVGLSWEVQTDSNGGGTFHFCALTALHNVLLTTSNTFTPSGQNFLFVDEGPQFIVPPGSTPDQLQNLIICTGEGSAFASCSVSLIGNTLSIFFFGGEIPQDHSFEMAFSQGNTSGPWPPDHLFFSRGNVAEPATLALLLPAFGYAAFRRRKGKSQ